MWLLVAYATPAAAAWTLAGLAAAVVPGGRAGLVAVTVYAAYYGLVQASGRPGLPAPGRTWQVPARWVDNVPRWRRTLVWGSLLGPGFATRNPYAGFGLLVLVVVATAGGPPGVGLAAAIGLAHATGRAGALLRDVRRTGAADYLQAVMRSIRWRMADGYALLAVAGIAAAALALHR